MPITREKTILGAAIREARKSRGMTQVEMAAMFGVTQASIAHWESGRQRPRQEAWVQLRSLGVSIGVSDWEAGYAAGYAAAKADMLMAMKALLP